jgi:hypothetical protein
MGREPFETPGQVAAVTRVPFAALVLAVSVAVAAGWALARHETHVMAPMIVPVGSPRSAPTFDADAGEFAAPELLGPASE